MQCLKKLSFILILLSFSSLAQAPFGIVNSQSPQGIWYSRIQNESHIHLYCYIGYSEFYVNPSSVSRWYPWSDVWGCQYI